MLLRDTTSLGCFTAKVALGERGPIWWDDGSPDLNRCQVATSTYADGYLSLSAVNSRTSKEQLAGENDQ